MKNFLPPPVTPSDEEPIATGGWQSFKNNERKLTINFTTTRDAVG
jgi:hypothetical protein